MRKINRVQRLARREEKDIVKRIFFLSIFSVVLIFVLLTVGITGLGKLADLLDVVFKGGEEVTVETSDLNPPILDVPPAHTNEEHLKVTGFSSGGDRIDIYLDDEKVGEAVPEAGKFSLELTLKNGLNRIWAKTIAGDRQSDFSQVAVVNFDKTAPKLEVSTPVDGQSFYGNNKVPVGGKTEPNVQVFVNGFLANVDTGGEFEVVVPVAEGDSELVVKALDDAGNETLVKIPVSFRK